MRRLAFVFVVAALVAPLLLDAPAEAGAPAAIVFASDRDDGFYEIYSMAADGSNVTRLTHDAGFDEHPDWSPDGTMIAWDSSRGGQRQIWVMDADGGNEQRISPANVFGSYPAWSPDGTRIAYLGANDDQPLEEENIDVYVMDLDGSNIERLTDDPAWDGAPAWSPDGTQMVFASERDGDREIYVMDADGSNQTNLTNFAATDDAPDWAQNNNGILFGREGELFVTPPDGAFKQNITNSEDEYESDASWAFGGQEILYVSGRDGNPEIYLWNHGTVAEHHRRLTNSTTNDYSPDWRLGEYAGNGDVSCDGIVNSVDAALVLQATSGLIAAVPCPENADVNADGRVDAIDAALILQFAAGLIDTLPPA